MGEHIVQDTQIELHTGPKESPVAKAITRACSEKAYEAVNRPSSTSPVPPNISGIAGKTP